MIWTLVALLAVGGAVDPRIEIIDARLAGEPERALEIADRVLETDPEGGRALGFDYLRGDLLERLDRGREADQAFAESISGLEQLSAYGRYRLALNQSRRRHPEVAAGLVATLLARNPPPPLVESAARLLAESLAHGGDCRLLRDLSSWHLSGEPRRLLEVSAIDCAMSKAPRDQSLERLLRLLEETIVDEPARLAADRLHRHFSSLLNKRGHLFLVGRAFHYQRQFELAQMYLERGLAAAPDSGEDATTSIEARYALARSLFWRAEYLQAVREFGRVASESRSSEDSARALYQQARSYELHGSWGAAANGYRRAYLEDVDGRWAAAALLSTLRLEWRRGREEEALTLLEVLGSRESWGDLYGRAALFLASSDLVQGRSERAGPWLLQARQARWALRPLVNYWTGRFEELQGNAEQAMSSYLEVIAAAPYHPLAQLARSRVAGENLEAAARAAGERLSSASDTRSLYRAHLLLGDTEAGQTAARKALSSLGQSRTAGPYLRLELVAPEEWPLWKARLTEPADFLLSLGLWNEGESATRRHFPLADISLAYTGSRLLSGDGAHRTALHMAEIVYEGALARMPETLIPAPLRRAAFPLPYGTRIAEAAARHEVDPYLLTALIREESRFDADAVSSASARGLAQFLLATADRLAPRVGLQKITTEDLHRPAVSIALGAAYLEELLDRFEGREYQAIAAYNAGENQSELWQSYCFSTEPAEFLTKVGFPETRSYLAKVLESRAQYADLYPPDTFSIP